MLPKRRTSSPHPYAALPSSPSLNLHPVPLNPGSPRPSLSPLRVPLQHDQLASSTTSLAPTPAMTSSPASRKGRPPRCPQPRRRRAAHAGAGARPCAAAPPWRITSGPACRRPPPRRTCPSSAPRRWSASPRNSNAAVAKTACSAAPQPPLCASCTLVLSRHPPEQPDQWATARTAVTSVKSAATAR